ncbi:permease prefix domain 1-containing protein [Oceanobacillus jeddahense]|uniref:permease prefix domain 1-containing protein n=1 Tax=Oceanobacillus jeddahense TaxID=1462527 RepID=UPI000595D36F|nr:permease prefix domain 1-containing protein [Oceanobacillus jeddahense]
MNRIEKHVEDVLKQMQSSGDEREEIREELLSHLNEAKSNYISEGFSEKQAEKKVIAAFGNSHRIGLDLQESMYPFQRELLYLIGIITLLFGVIFYVNLAFVIREPEPVWLIIQLLLGSIVMLAAINISFVGRYFYLLNVLLMFNIIWNGINVVLMQGLSQWQAIFFSGYLLILIGLGLLFVFRNSYYYTNQIGRKHQKQGFVKFSYMMNLLYGIIIIILCLFFLWTFIVFTGPSIAVFITLLPILIWMIFYKYQMKFIARKPALSLATGLGVSTLAVVISFVILRFSFGG